MVLSSKRSEIINLQRLKCSLTLTVNTFYVRQQLTTERNGSEEMDKFQYWEENSLACDMNLASFLANKCTADLP